MMKRNVGFGLVLIMGLMTFGCGQKVSKEMASEGVSTEVKAAVQAAVDPATAGSLSGKVMFEGAVPPAQKLSVQGNPECSTFHAGGTIESEEIVSQNGMLQNVLVYVKEGLENYTFAAPLDAVRIDNNQCIYKPHVAAAQVGQPVELYNSDPTLHNMHSYSTANKAFNVGLPIQGMKQVKKFGSAELPITIKCDVHPWMKGYLAVLPHPYFAVTGADGAFTIGNLPPGEYLVEAWHEKLGAQSQKIKIEPQSAQTAEFTFSA
ncbi:MAG: carboxypeptidase regulatory-like domain-containing protein [Candidatus Omnitrophota bacterium]